MGTGREVETLAPTRRGNRPRGEPSQQMPIESSGHSSGNPRLYEVIENTPKSGKSPTVWAWPQLIDYLKVAGQPVQGPWPPHQHPRPDPTEVESGPIAVPDPGPGPGPALGSPGTPSPTPTTEEG